MTLRIAQLVRTYHDVIDSDFLRDFPDVEAAKASNPKELADAVRGAEVFQTNDSAFTREVADVLATHGQSLRWIQMMTVGTDHAAAAGIPPQVWVTNVGEIRQTILSGHAIALMLAVMRGFHRYEPDRARHAWGRDQILPYLIPPEGGHMVVCGMGTIGRDLARKAKAFDMEVTCITRADAPASPDIDRVVPRERIRDVLGDADAVMVAMPLDESTRGFIGARELAAMKPTAVVVNISRGPVVDEAALAEALRAGAILGAGLDVFTDEPLPPESPFWDLPNAVITPHIGGMGGTGQWDRLSALVRENTRRYLDGQPLINVVKEPQGAA